MMSKSLVIAIILNSLSLIKRCFTRPMRLFLFSYMANGLIGQDLAQVGGNHVISFDLIFLIW
jgi:hypothetical protein